MDHPVSCLDEHEVDGSELESALAVSMVYATKMVLEDVGESKAGYRVQVLGRAGGLLRLGVSAAEASGPPPLILGLEFGIETELTDAEIEAALERGINAAAMVGVVD